MDETFTPPPTRAITPEEWQQTPPRVQTWIRELCAENKQLRETVEQLQEIVNRNAQNSSQPPSQDRPDQKPAKEPSSPPRKRGGQPGHRGHHRASVDEVDEVVIHKPTSCAGCGALLLGDDPAPYRHQVTELPIVTPKVIEHQVHRLDCPRCGQCNRGELPPEVAASWFGPNVISLVGLLMGRYRLSKRQVTHLLAECFGITMAARTVVNQQQVISQALAAPVVELEPVVKNEPVCKLMKRAGDTWAHPNAPGCGQWWLPKSLSFALHPVAVAKLPGSCWVRPMGAWRALTAVVPTPGCNDVNSVGVTCCAISRKFSNAVTIHIPSAGI